ncbi:MAG: non-canonical purine NTP pyrophosphatase [Candidatus Brocadiia bacterium]
MQIVIGTKNKGKIREINSIYRQWLGKRASPFRLIPLNTFPNVPDVQETGRTYLDNARKKALCWARYTNRIVLAEDSGIEIETLNWRPGIYSARFASKDMHHNATDKENHSKLLAELAGLRRNKRRARYCCTAVLACPEDSVRRAHPSKGILFEAEGICYGYIAQKPAGSKGFGYDPVFCPEKKAYASKTFGQLPAYIKNRLSHRGKAIRKIFQELSKILDTALKPH